MTYTIDIKLFPDYHWRWSIYDRGGSRHVTDGRADSIEEALDHAKTELLVLHRAELENQR